MAQDVPECIRVVYIDTLLVSLSVQEETKIEICTRHVITFRLHCGRRHWGSQAKRLCHDGEPHFTQAGLISPTKCPV